METRNVTNEKSIGKRTSHEGIDGLLDTASGTVTNEKCIGEEISHKKTDDWDE